ncbi:hypothetical protein IF090_12445 [Acinetobacter towneri]|uniref:hypothetical protein n=1 Tax=Acinetobacter towneri TaxID=202956 RepID=UPI001CE08856|nr:hypothetical protein [Acinetobacter towneri]MCA4780425.1 hypothetical protein [Acinetobacter towneri]MCA4784940.1 hypothetical protein [Acinetobacter towneri]MCA4788052.1 hypothetical protein [Acinetobacter towneri]MCA4796026.1 hypothetical protein [Acinetobacter towneri]MCA4801983.1 hypothetical protein [Acinetobacter towneri]
MTQTSIFKDSRITPEAGRQVVLNMMTGQIVSPAVYDPKSKLLLCSGGSARPYMIKSWAYLEDVNHALGLEATDAETLEHLKKQAEDDTCECDVVNHILEVVLNDLSEILPDAIKKDIQEMMKK